MLRRAALLLATMLACGCQNMGTGGANGPFGSQRVPAPGTNAYTKPDGYYDNNLGAPAAAPAAAAAPSPAATGFNPAKTFSQPSGTENFAAGAGATAGANGNFSLFNDRPGSAWGNSAGPSVTPTRFDSTTANQPGQPAVRFGDTKAAQARSTIGLNGMPLNDATRPPVRTTSGSATYPEMTSLPPAGTPYYPPGYAAPNVPAYPPGYAVPNVPAYPPGYTAPNLGVPPYAPGSIGTSSSGDMGWKTKSPTAVSNGTSFR